MILTLLLLSFYKTETPSKHRPEQQGALRASIKWMKLHESLVFLTHPQLLPVIETVGQAYAVALYSNEIHRQRDWFIAVLVQCFNIVQEVRKELVAPFKHAESNNVVPPHVLDYISSQSLSPAPVTQRRTEKRRHVDEKCVHMNASRFWLEPCFWTSFACSPALHWLVTHLI